MRDRTQNSIRMEEIYRNYSTIFNQPLINHTHTKIAAQELADFINGEKAETVIIKGTSASGSLVKEVGGVWEPNQQTIAMIADKVQRSSDPLIFTCISSDWNCTLDKLEEALNKLINS